MAAEDAGDLKLKVDLLDRVARALSRKLRKMEAKLANEEAKKDACLDKLLTLEGYWSGPPSPHEGSPSNSGDEKAEPEPQQPAPGKRKAPEQPAPLLGKGSPHQRLLMMQQPRAHKPGSSGGKPKVEEEELLSGNGADIIASLTNAAMSR